MMGPRLHGAVALVAGGSRGIGFAAADRLAQEGAHVLLVGRSEPTVAAALRQLEGRPGGEVDGVVADLATDAGVDRAVRSVLDRFGRVSLLVNAAGLAVDGRIDDVTDADWERAFATKLMSAVRSVRALLPWLEREHGASIVNVAGLSGWQPQPTSVVGGSVNAALLNFGRAMAWELGPRGVRINTVVPGRTATDRFSRTVERRVQETGQAPSEVIRSLEAAIPLGRVPDPEEVASVIAFLLSAEAGQITGAAISVDGGAGQGVH